LVELARDARLERPREKRGSLVPPVGAERMQGVGWAAEAGSTLKWLLTSPV
jgi:hypothetical protein